MASSSSRPVITVKQQHKTGDSVITVNQQHQTGDSVITVNQQRETGDSVITVKHQRQTGDSVITVKQEHESGDVLISVKQQQHPIPTDDSFITVEIVTLARHKCYIRVRCDERLQQLKTRYKEQEGIPDYQVIHFISNGRRFGDDDKTVNDVGLKDGDSIDVILHLIGD